MTLNGVMALLCVISANSGSFRAHCVKVHVRYLMTSPDEFLFLFATAIHHIPGLRDATATEEDDMDNFTASAYNSAPDPAGGAYSTPQTS